MAIMAINWVITAIMHALAGVSLAVMAKLIKVVQSRVIMAIMAVIALCWVTQGAGVGVPISGVTEGLLTGQVTSSARVSTGADRSEPQRPSRRARGVQVPC